MISLKVERPRGGSKEKKMKIAGLLIAFALLGGPATGHGAEPKRVVVCDYDRDPGGLDPFFELSEKKHTLIQQIFEGLVRYDADGEVVPALATSWEQTDPLHLRFHLREGVEFQNGEPFDAASVKYTLDRFIDPSVGSPTGGLLSSIEKVVIVSSSVVDVVTRFPDAVLLRRLAGLVTFVPPAYYQQAGSEAFGKKPVGTGAFELESWEPGRRMVLRANKRYWARGLPRIDQLVFRFITSPEEQVSELLKGKVDIVTELPGTATLKVKGNPSTTVIKKESLYTVGGHFNTQKPPFSDLRVRQAVNYAINKPELIRYDLLGNGEPAATMSAPGEVGYNTELQPYPYDPAKARALLKAAGVKLPLTVKTFIVPFVERAAKIVKKQLAEVGIVLDLHVRPEAEAVQALKNEEWGLSFTTLPCPLVHVAFAQALLFYSRSPYSLNKDPLFDKQFEEASGATDPADSVKKFQALDKFVHDEALGLFLYRRTKTYGVSRKVKFTPYITGMAYFMDAVSLEEK